MPKAVSGVSVKKLGLVAKKIEEMVFHLQN